MANASLVSEKYVNQKKYCENIEWKTLHLENIISRLNQTLANSREWTGLHLNFENVLLLSILPEKKKTSKTK